MNVIALLIGALIIAAALRDTHRELFGLLAQDVPAYMVWAAALFAVGAIGFIPGLKPVSRGILALVLLVIVLRNYEAIVAGLRLRVSDITGAGSDVAGIGSGAGAIAGSAGFNPTNFLGDLAKLGDFAGNGSSPPVVLT